MRERKIKNINQKQQRAYPDENGKLVQCVITVGGQIEWFVLL